MKWCVALALSLWVAEARADSSVESVAPPTSAVGGGVGFPGIVHVDYQRWIGKHTFVELGLTPLLLHNVVSVGLNQELRLSPSSWKTEHGLAVGAEWMHIVNIGGIAGGPGVQLGYQFRRGWFGMSVSGWVGQAVGGEFSGEGLQSTNVTLWAVKRTKQP